MEIQTVSQDQCDMQLYETANISPYIMTSTPSSSSSPGTIVSNGMYPEYTDWPHPTQTELHQYVSYPQIPQTEMVSPGTFWQGDIHHGITSNFSYPTMERVPTYEYTSNLITPTSTPAPANPTTKSGKPKRKRVQSVPQRRAANIRERRRMFHLNEAFDDLRKRLPAFNYEKRLSRIETLRLAMTYISFMKDISEGEDPKEIKLQAFKSDSNEMYTQMHDKIGENKLVQEL